MEVAREVIVDGGCREKGSRRQKKGEGKEVKKSVQAGNSNFSRLKPTTTQSHMTDDYYKERRGVRGQSQPSFQRPKVALSNRRL